MFVRLPPRRSSHTFLYFAPQAEAAWWLCTVCTITKAWERSIQTGGVGHHFSCCFWSSSYQLTVRAQHCGSHRQQLPLFLLLLFSSYRKALRLQPLWAHSQPTMTPTSSPSETWRQNRGKSKIKSIVVPVAGGHKANRVTGLFHPVVWRDLGCGLQPATSPPPHSRLTTQSSGP